MDYDISPLELKFKKIESMSTRVEKHRNPLVADGESDSPMIKTSKILKVVNFGR